MWINETFRRNVCRDRLIDKIESAVLLRLSHATKIEAANVISRPDINWTINGSILFGVDSVDDDTSSQMLSFFAGRE